jgi:hypothetical protein
VFICLAENTSPIPRFSPQGVEVGACPNQFGKLTWLSRFLLLTRQL